MVFKIRLEAYTTAYEVNTPYAVYEAGNLQNFDYSANMPVVTFGMPEYYHEGAILTKAEGNTAKVIFTWVIKDETKNPFTTMNTWDTILTKVSAGEFYPFPKFPDLDNGSPTWTGTNIQKCHDATTNPDNNCTQTTAEHNGDPLPYPNGSKYTSRRLFTNSAGSTTYASYDTLTADGQMVALSEYFEKKGISGAERQRFILFNEGDDKYIFSQEGLITRMSFQKAGTDPVTWNATVEFQVGYVVDSGE